ncbi:LysR family transcriptional regulator [Lactobacillus sp. ESL0791]|uniref:LysR family transcriptional regulator n=1 Tax=Lactobacillus sp. ESL0791 TaxID=2983234 RepID=UPI0023F8E359|nr:LysR family transcriptional regulator [Lactobacillus sp. ESL0791]MDF7639858.1 LysR family transcriptional regulator [Lactobacillus sp. ESL0791]
MNLNDLKIFRSIYELGSLNKAAQALGYAQSNVTARLQSLEKEFATTLFLRTQKGVMPTKAGRILYSASLNIEAELAKVTAEISKQGQSLLGDEVLVNYVLHNDSLFQGSNFTKIIVKTQSTIAQEAASNLYDMIVTFVDLTKNKNYHRQKEGLLAANYLVSSADESARAEMPVLVNSDPQCAFRKQTLHDLQQEEQITEVDSLQAIETLVKQGKGIALLPSSVAEQESLIKLKKQDVYLQYYIYQANVG